METNPDYFYRPLTLNDLEQVKMLDVTVFGPKHGWTTDQTQRYLTSAWFAHGVFILPRCPKTIQNTENTETTKNIKVLVDEPVLVGMLVVEPNKSSHHFPAEFLDDATENNEEIFLVRTLEVHPQHRGKGLGSNLLTTFLDIFLFNSYRKISNFQNQVAQNRIVALHVKPDNQVAKNLYERVGFATYCTLSDYYNPGDDAMLMFIRS